MRRDGTGTHNSGMFCDGSPEQRGGVDEMVQGRGVPNLPRSSVPQIAKGGSVKSGGTNRKEQRMKGMRMRQNVVSRSHLLVCGVLGAEHVRAVGAESKSSDPCSTQPLIPVV